MNTKRTFLFRRRDNDQVVKHRMSDEDFEAARLFGTRFVIDEVELTLMVREMLEKEGIIKPQVKRVHAPGAGWPMRSDFGLSCLPNQVDGFNEQLVEEGRSGVRFEKGTGVCVIEDRKSYKAYCESRGYFMKNASCGDPVPLNQ